MSERYALIVRKTQAISLLAIIYFSCPSFALSCRVPLGFVLECKAGMCGQGFFAFFKRTGNQCDTVLEVKEEDPIYPVAQTTEFIADFKPKFDGYYRINDSLRFPWERDINKLNCFDLNDKKEIVIRCSEQKLNPEKIDTAGDSIVSIKREFVVKSKLEAALSNTKKVTVPLLLLVLIFIRLTKLGKRHSKKFTTAIALVTLCLSPSIILYGWQEWAISFLVGFGFLLGVAINGIIRKIRKRIAPKP